MARKAQASLTVTAIAKNEMGKELAAAGGDINKLGAIIQSAEKKSLAVSEAAIKTEQNRMKMVRSLPEGFAKAGTALSVFGAANSNMGTAVTMATGKLSQLGALVGAGGPVGIAIAAGALAVAAATHTWGVYTLATRNTDAAIRSLDAIIAASNKRMADQRAATLSAEQALRFFGKTQLEISIIQAQEANAAQAAGTAIVMRDIEVMNARLAALQPNIELMNEWNGSLTENAVKERNRASATENERRLLVAQIAALEKATQGAAANTKERQRQIAATEALITKMRQQKEGQEAVTRAEREGEVAAREGQAARNARATEFEREMANKRAIREADAARAKQIAAEEKAANEASAQAQVQMFAQIGDALALSQDKIGLAIFDTTVSTARSAILASAASAYAKQLDAHAIFPLIGIALGVAAGAAVAGLIRKQLANIPKAHAGERIPGTGEQLRTVEGGERILNRRETRELESGGQRGGSVTISAQIQNPEEMTDAQIKRWLIRINRQAEELHRDGLFMAVG